MTRKLILASAVGTLLSSLAWSGARDTATIAGLVVDANGQGLPGAAVVLSRQDGGQAAHVVSGYGGAFRIASLAVGAYSIQARFDGLAPARPVSASLKPGETTHVRLVFPKPVYHEVVEVAVAAGALAAAEVRESAARDVGEALANVAGIAVIRKGGIANDVALRGLQRDNINVLIDGERIHGACPNRMDAPAFHVDFSEIERVEMTKGPFDVESQGSLGGVINVVTRKAERGFHGTATLVGGSYGFVNPSLVVSHGTDKLAATAGYSYRTSDPYRDARGQRITAITNYSTSAFDSTSFQANTGWAKVYATPGRGHAFELAYTRQEANPVLYPGLLMDAAWDNTDRVSLAWQKTWDSGAVRNVRVRSYGTRVHHWMTDELRASGVGKPTGWSMGSMADASTLGGKADAEIAGFKVGIEVLRRGWNMTTQMAGMSYASQAAIPDVVTSVAGVFARRSVAISRPLHLDLGARLDRARTAADASRAPVNLYDAYNSTRSTARSDTLPAGNARLTWAPSSRLSLSAGLGHCARVPDPAERYLGLKRSGSDWVGNPDVRPAHNTGTDLSAAWRHGGGSLKASLFYTSLDDLIAVHSQPRVNKVSGVMNASARSYVNVDARMWGGELELTHVLTTRLFVAGNVSWTRGTKDADPARHITSSNLGEVPPLAGRLAMRWDDGRRYGEVEGVFAAAQNRVDADLQELATAGWGVVNVKAGATLAGTRLQAVLGNAFNRQYTQHLAFSRDPFRAGVRVYEPGRSLTLTVLRRF